VEVLLGVTVDPRIGPALVVGAGGIYTEVLDDAALMLAPATASSVRAGVATLRINQMLGGMRGQAPADVDSLVSTAVALSEFAWAARDELVAIDVNPVIVHAAGRGVTAVDAAVLTGPRASQSTAASPAGEEPT
jgi:acyl-CoA synthetase (NDP forming)